MADKYDLVMYRGTWCLYWRDEDNQPRRRSLGTADKGTAVALKAEIEEIEARTKAARATIEDLWEDYRQAREGRKVAARMPSEWKQLAPIFAGLYPQQINEEVCRRYIAHRRALGRKDSTIISEINRVAGALHYAHRRGRLDRVPVLAYPPKPPPKDIYLTREQVRRLLDASPFPHIRTFIALAITTAARKTAILELTWDRVDLERRRIDLRTAGPATAVAVGALPERKARSVVPINGTALAALLAAKERARSTYVVEWAGQRVLNVKKGLATAAEKAGLPWATAHVYRHSAAVWMVEAGVPLEEVAQYLGHDSVATTRRVYAKYSPTYLQGAASALELV